MLNPEYYDEDDGIFMSDLTDKGYCSDDCLDAAEEDYKKEFWHYSDYDEDYYQYSNDLTTYLKYNNLTCEYEEKTISKDSFFELLENDEIHEWGGQYFDTINEEEGKPFGYESLIEFNLAA